MSENNGCLHKGHRKRLRNKYIMEGIDKLETHQILEVLLFNTIQQKDTNEIAHNLLNHFGSLSSVLEAPAKSLMEVDGVGEVTASFLSMIPDICRVYLCDKDEKEVNLITNRTVYDIILNMYVGLNHERVYVFFFNVKNKLIFKGIVSDGNFNSSNIYVPKLVSLAVNCSASQAIISHNHPTGMALPSSDDIDTTIKIMNALNGVNVKLIDHIIVADDDFISLMQDKFFEQFEEG